MRKKEIPTERQLETLKDLGIAAPNTRKSCAMILSWIYKGGNESSRRIAILKDGQGWVGKRVRDREASMRGTVLFVLPKTPEALLKPCRAESASHDYRHPLDARIRRDDGKMALVSVGRIVEI